MPQPPLLGLGGIRRLGGVSDLNQDVLRAGDLERLLAAFFLQAAQTVPLLGRVVHPLVLHIGFFALVGAIS